MNPATHHLVNSAVEVTLDDTIIVSVRVSVITAVSMPDRIYPSVKYSLIELDRQFNIVNIQKIP